MRRTSEHQGVQDRAPPPACASGCLSGFPPPIRGGWVPTVVGEGAPDEQPAPERCAVGGHRTTEARSARKARGARLRLQAAAAAQRTRWQAVPPGLRVAGATAKAGPPSLREVEAFNAEARHRSFVGVG